MASITESHEHHQESSSHLSCSEPYAKMVQQIAELLWLHTGSRWVILHLTRYEEHWVVLGYQGGQVRDFLLGQTRDSRLVYHVAEKTVYPLSENLWRYSIGAYELLELVTYVVQYGGEQCNESTITTAFTQATLRDYLLNEHESGTDVLVTRFYGEQEEGEGRYHKHLDGTFTTVYEDVGSGGLLEELHLPSRQPVVDK